MIRVAVYTDSPILAHGFRTVLATDEDLAVSGIHSYFRELIECPPDTSEIFLIDLTPEVTFAALSELKRSAGGVKVLLWANAISSELAFQALGLGIRGVVRKTLSSELLLKCLHKVHEGELWFEKALTDSFLAANRIPLTRREGQLVTLLSQGKKNKEIASLLMITEGTVKVYLSKLYDKLGVKDRFELALYGLKNLGTSRNAAPVEETGSLAVNSVPPLRSLIIERR